MIFMVVVIWNGNKYKCHTKNKMVFKLGVTSINQAFKKDLYGIAIGRKYVLQCHLILNAIIRIPVWTKVEGQVLEK